MLGDVAELEVLEHLTELQEEGPKVSSEQGEYVTG